MGLGLVLNFGTLFLVLVMVVALVLVFESRLVGVLVLALGISIRCGIPEIGPTRCRCGPARPREIIVVLCTTTFFRMAPRREQGGTEA